MTVAAAPGATVPLTFSTKSPTRYGALPEDSGRPAMIVSSRGKGRAIYVAGDLGGTIHKVHLLEHLQLIRNIVADSGASPLEIADCPQSVEVSLRPEPRRPTGPAALGQLHWRDEPTHQRRSAAAKPPGHPAPAPPRQVRPHTLEAPRTEAQRRRDDCEVLTGPRRVPGHAIRSGVRRAGDAPPSSHGLTQDAPTRSTRRAAFAAVRFAGRTTSSPKCPIYRIKR